MNITDVKIRKVFTDPQIRIKAIVSVTLDGDFAVHDMKVIQGMDRLFVAMPSRRSEDGRFQDIAHPTTQEARKQLETAIFAAYEEALKQAEGSNHDN